MPWPTSTPTPAFPGAHFEASAVPSLKQFIREVTMEVASPKGGSVYDEWKKDLGDLLRGATRAKSSTIPRWSAGRG